MSKIEIKNVSFSYNDDVKVIKNLSLDLHEGEFTCILGHNGSGKSTLAKLLNGLCLPDEGSVLVDDLNTADDSSLWEIRSKVGMVFQNPDDQLIATVVEDDIAFGPENLGVEPSEIRKRIDESLQIVEMQDYIKRPSHQLSGGQKQRIAIAGVLAMKPSVVVFDEPTSMLDPVGRKEVLQTILKLRDNNITVILITHYMTEALLADRVVVMKDGKLELDGKPSTIFKSSKRLHELSLKLPETVEISTRLRDEGFAINENALTIDEICAEIIRLKPDNLGSYSVKRPIGDKVCDENLAINLQKANYFYNKDTIYQQHAVKDIDLQINSGEFIGVIGHTGSGKSTLMQILNGLNKLDSGSLEVFDFTTDVAKPDYGKLREKVGLVFQYPEYQLFEETVAKDVSFGPLNLGVKKSEVDSIVDEALRAVRLEPSVFRDLSPFQLSGGEKRRVAIAGVMAMKPQILILDEPAAGLDPISRDDVLDFVKSEHDKNNSTTLIVSHNMSEIAVLCDKVLVIAGGKIVAFDSVSDVYSKRELLLSLGLDVPPISTMTAILNENGFNIDATIFDVDTWIKALLACLRGERNA